MSAASERIKKLRLNRHESQQVVADAIGITRASYARIEDGSRGLTNAKIVALAKYFNVSSDYILGLSDAPMPNLSWELMCEYTGLSGEALKSLHCNADIAMIINDLLVRHFNRKELFR